MLSITQKSKQRPGLLLETVILLLCSLLTGEDCTLHEYPLFFFILDRIKKTQEIDPEEDKQCEDVLQGDQYSLDVDILAICFR